MAEYKLSNEAKADIIRIHQYGVERFGMVQADRYPDILFRYFDMIAERPFSFEAVNFLKEGYRRCVCGSDTIYFKINNNAVEILTIVGRQDLNNIL